MRIFIYTSDNNIKYAAILYCSTLGGISILILLYTRKIIENNKNYSNQYYYYYH